MNMQQIGRGAVAAAMLASLAACSAMSSIGSVLGGVIPGGGSRGSQVSGYVSGVDTRAQVIGLQQPNGQPVNLLFDNQTRVVYNNQNYPVTSLDPGDQITARIQNTNNGYYTDLVQVDQPVRSTAGTTSSSGTVQSVQGTVRQVDRQNGLFTLDVSNGPRIVVSMPYSPSRTDLARFQNLRSGDAVRIAGVLLNSSRMELRQFY